MQISYWHQDNKSVSYKVLGKDIMGGRTLVGKSENAARREFIFDENLKVKRIFTKGGKHSAGRTRVSLIQREGRKECCHLGAENRRVLLQGEEMWL